MRGDPIEVLVSVFMVLAIGLLNALPIGIVVYFAIRLALPRELFERDRSGSDCREDGSDELGD